MTDTSDEQRQAEREQQEEDLAREEQYQEERDRLEAEWAAKQPPERS